MYRPDLVHNTLVVTVEGLGTGLVGAYGSGGASTPAIDALAAQGVLLDQCFVDAQDLPGQLRSLWTGRHAQQACPLPSPRDDSNTRPLNLWAMLEHRPNFGARLITDCEHTAQLADQAGCPDVICLAAHLDEVPAPVEDASDSCLAIPFAAAAEVLTQGSCGLLWVHSRGLRLPWDAPIDLRARFADPEDPPPPSETRVPALDIGPGDDPDFALGWAQVAAAQAHVFDLILGDLLDTLKWQATASPWSLVLIGLGGVPLGEHGHLGWGRKQLYGEELQCVSLVCPHVYAGTSNEIGRRRPEIFQLPDIAATLGSLLQLEYDPGIWGRNILALGAAERPNLWPSEFKMAMTKNINQRWLRVPAWSSLCDCPTQEPIGTSTASRSIELSSSRLYVKPDDRWEFSDVASRRRDIVDLQQQAAQAFELALSAGARPALPSLDDALCNLIR